MDESAGYLETKLDQPLSLTDGYAVHAVITIPPIIIYPLTIIDMGLQDGPRLTLSLLPGGLPFGRYKYADGTEATVTGRPVCKTPVEDIRHHLSLQVTEPARPTLTIWHQAGILRSESYTKRLDQEVRGSVRLLADFECQQPARGVTIAMSSFGRPLDSEQILSFFKATEEYFDAIKPPLGASTETPSNLNN